MRAFTPESGDSDPGAECEEIKEEPCEYADPDNVMGVDPFQTREPMAFPDNFPAPMNLLTANGQNANVTYITPYTVAQLTDIAKTIEVFEPTEDPNALFENTCQHGRDVARTGGQTDLNVLDPSLIALYNWRDTLTHGNLQRSGLSCGLPHVYEIKNFP
ncbi:hypothetical protein scyTo_0023025 [Scyliorhinus torazame]|uniref:Uncharacterized protein n=1 Tax=Scyliorhinus torazame TaxID=75743 RepID=A0A401Q8U5_SCYTO|nr:hypothetical protein [Scyliorhinus torazame]